MKYLRIILIICSTGAITIFIECVSVTNYNRYEKKYYYRLVSNLHYSTMFDELEFAE